MSNELKIYRYEYRPLGTLEPRTDYAVSTCPEAALTAVRDGLVKRFGAKFDLSDLLEISINDINDERAFSKVADTLNRLSPKEQQTGKFWLFRYAPGASNNFNGRMYVYADTLEEAMTRAQTRLDTNEEIPSRLFRKAERMDFDTVRASVSGRTSIFSVLDHDDCLAFVTDLTNEYRAKLIEYHQTCIDKLLNATDGIPTMPKIPKESFILEQGKQYIVQSERELLDSLAD